MTATPVSRHQPVGLPAPSRESHALITGASQGIGQAMARDFAAIGFNVVLVARREEVLSRLADELQSRHGVEATPLAADLSQADGVDRVVDFINGHEVSIVVNSAGIASFGPFTEQDWDYETAQFALNGTAATALPAPQSCR